MAAVQGLRLCMNRRRAITCQNLRNARCRRRSADTSRDRAVVLCLRFCPAIYRGHPAIYRYHTSIFGGDHAAIYGGGTTIYGGDTAIYGGSVVIYGSHAAVYGGDTDKNGGRAVVQGVAEGGSLRYPTRAPYARLLPAAVRCPVLSWRMV
eukprot:1631150-Rhodomonas_salina.11